MIGNKTDRAIWGRCAVPLAVALLSAVPGVVRAQVTYAEDVAPIIQENCQVCHHPGAIGPMSLLTYDDAYRYARRIKEKVQGRLMPPWQIEPGIGIQDFKNDVSLSAQEIATIVRWVDSGMAEGDLANLPESIDWEAIDAAGGWKLAAGDQMGRPPDMVVATPAFDVVPNGQDQWWFPVTKLDLTQRRWVKAAEIRPGNAEARYVFHHGNSRLLVSAAGKDFDIYPEDAGTPLDVGEELSWNLHFFPIGRLVEGAFMEVGVWFYPDDAPPQHTARSTSFRADAFHNGSVLPSGNPCWKQPAQADLDSPECTRLTRANELVIPPNGHAMLQGVHVLDRLMRIHSIRGHMHMRGRAHTLEAIYPDGRHEVLNRINFDQRWHIAHVYADDVRPLLPKGTVLIVNSYFDNTADNPTNPDPSQWVTFGRRSASEMSHMWIGVTYFDNEADFQKLVDERNQKDQTVAVR